MVMMTMMIDFLLRCLAGGGGVWVQNINEDGCVVLVVVVAVAVFVLDHRHHHHYLSLVYPYYYHHYEDYYDYPRILLLFFDLVIALILRSEHSHVNILVHLTVPSNDIV